MRYESPPVEDRQIWDIWLSMHYLPAMAIADELGVLQSLAAAPKSSPDIARELALEARGTDTLLGMLAALKLVHAKNGTYELAEVARTDLLPQSPFYWGPLLRGLGVLPKQRAALLRALKPSLAEPVAEVPPREGKPADAWEAGKIGLEQAKRVSSVMHCHSLPAAVAAAELAGFENVKRLLDVGGGSGCFSIAIAQRFPSARCTIMELPAVCEVARGYIADGGVTDRVDTVSVDMFREAWPTGYDAIFFSNIFHDWDVDTNTGLARSAFQALPSGGTIFLHEMLLADDGGGPLTTASFSMLMLTGTKGRQYSLKGLTEILTKAGFVDVRCRATSSYYSVVSATKP